MKPSWTDADVWRKLLEGTDCPLCSRGSRPGVAAELTSCFVTVDESVGVRGYCCLVLRQHRVELHELSIAEGAALMRDIQHAARAVQRITGCVKVNYEIHGNVIPHVHVHIVPRYPGDAIEVTGLPFNRVASAVWAPGELPQYAAALRAALEEA